MIAALVERLQQMSWKTRQLPAWSHYAREPGEVMRWPAGDRFHAKQGRDVGRYVLRDRGVSLRVFVKRHHLLPRWRGWLSAIAPEQWWSPAAREWDNLETVRRLGVPVPRAWAAGECVGPWGRLQSFLAVEELSGMLALHEALPLAAKRLPSVAFARWKKGLLRELARMVRALHQAGLYHRDLYLCHFFVAEIDTGCTPPDWRGRIVLIDFHRLTRRTWFPPRLRAKDLAQLLFSSEHIGLTERDRIRFWNAYRGPARLTWLRRLVLWMAARYQRKNRPRTARAA